MIVVAAPGPREPRCSQGGRNSVVVGADDLPDLGGDEVENVVKAGHPLGYPLRQRCRLVTCRVRLLAEGIDADAIAIRIGQDAGLGNHLLHVVARPQAGRPERVDGRQRAATPQIPVLDRGSLGHMPVELEVGCLELQFLAPVGPVV
jgi:hypothetical protein